MSVRPRPPRRLVVRLATNAVIHTGGSGLASMIGLFTFVAVTRGLGPEAFGDFTTAMAFLFLPIVVADVGLAATVLRDISASPDRTERVMGAALPLRALIAAAAVGLAVGIGMAIPFNEQTQTAILIGSLGTFLHLLTLSLVPAIQAQLKMHLAVGANLTGRVVTLAFTLAALNAGLGFKSIMTAHVTGLAVTFVLHLLVVTRLVSLRPIIDGAYWRSLLRGALTLGLAVSLAQIYFRVDTLLLALLTSPTEVGLYGAAYKFIELSQFVVGGIAVSVFPPLARFIATGDPRAQRLIQKSFDVLLAVAAPLALAMIVLSSQIILLTSGAEFLEAGAALQLLAPYVLFSFVNGLIVRILLGFSRDRTLLAIAVAILTLNVSLNLVFIPVYGFRAAAVISVVSEAFALVIGAVAVSRLGALPKPRYAVTVLIAVALMAALVLALPGPRFLVVGVAAAGYLLVLLVVPGTIRELARNLVPKRPSVGPVR